MRLRLGDLGGLQLASESIGRGFHGSRCPGPAASAHCNSTSATYSGAFPLGFCCRGDSTTLGVLRTR